MRNKYIQAFEEAQISKRSIPEFRAGDTLRVAIRITEGEKTRIQNFEGICIAKRGTGTGKTFIIRKIGAITSVLREFSHFMVKTSKR